MNAKTTRTIKSHPNQTRGFSLVEVLIALGVFAVGFIAVASMFPAAIILQKQTMVDLETKVIEQNAAGVIKGRGLTFSTSVAADLGPNVPNTAFPSPLMPFNDPLLGLGTKWTLADRGYPTFVTDVARRRFFWVPFLRRTSKNDPMNSGTPLAATPNDYLILGFIQKREPGKTYINAATDYSFVANGTDGDEVPKVVRVAVTVSGQQFTIAAAETQEAKNHFAAFEPGNVVATNLGTTYVISDIVGTTITVEGIVPSATSPTPVTHLWYGAPADDKLNTSTVAIVTLAGLVKDITPSP